MTTENIYDKTDFYFREKDIAIALNISIKDLDNIVEQIDNSDKFKWEEYLHYTYTNRNLKERHFSRDGLLTIAEYLCDDRDKVAQILSLISQFKIKKIDGEIRRVTYEEYP